MACLAGPSRYRVELPSSPPLARPHRRAAAAAAAEGGRRRPLVHLSAPSLMFFLAVEKWAETASPAESGVFPWDPVALLTCDLRQMGLVERWAWELGSGEVTRRASCCVFCVWRAAFWAGIYTLVRAPPLTLTHFFLRRGRRHCAAARVESRLLSIV